MQQLCIVCASGVSSAAMPPKKPSHAYRSRLRVSRDGRRMVMDTVPASTAGGTTNCARCPDGKVSDTIGSAAVMRCPVLLSFTTVVQKCRARLYQAVHGHHCQPPRVSRYTPPGR